MVSVTVNGEPYQYECEATAGLDLASGTRWFGTHIRWRPGTSGRWRRFNVIDLHPFDFIGVSTAVKQRIRDQVPHA